MLKTNKDIVADQLQLLCNITGSVVNMKRALEGEDCKLSKDAGEPLDATIVNGLNRIDQILRDDSKWALPADCLDQMVKMGAAQVEGQYIDNQVKLNNIAIARRHNEIVLASALGKLNAQSAPVSQPQQAPRRKK